MAEIFGFEIKRKKEKKKEAEVKSFVLPNEDDTSSVISSAGGHYGQYVNLSGDDVKNERDLILKYRSMAETTECDMAIEDICNESISTSEASAPVELFLEDLDQPNRIKKAIKEEFDTITELLSFNSFGHEIFRKWYIDGRLYYHIIIDENSPKKGIQELRYVDPLKIRKVREVETVTDPKTGAKLTKVKDEHFIFQDAGLSHNNQGIKIHKDSICFVPSGVVDSTKTKIISFLHKAIKPLNQLNMMEDSLVIYRLSRAPERRIFYIDVGNLPKGKAEEYLRGIMNQYRNKLVYDASTGEMKDDRKHMSMLEDFWLPRREGGRGTEITTLPGGQNLGDIEDIAYFQKKLYRSLNVPINRLEQESQFSLGRSSEIARDEVKFQRFIDKLRAKFSVLFFNLLRTQLILKGIITEDDWVEIKEQINVNYIRDSNFSELKEAELWRERVNTLREMEEYVGKYFSVGWVRRNILRMTDDEMDDMDGEIEDEKEKYPEDEFDTEPEDNRSPRPPTPGEESVKSDFL